MGGTTNNGYQVDVRGNILPPNKVNPVTSAKTSAMITSPSVGSGSSTKYSQLVGLSNPVYAENGALSYSPKVMASMTPDQRSAFDTYNSQFDTNYTEMFNTGIGAANTIMGALGTWDSMKTNEKQREAIDQNMEHAAMARADRTAFLSDTKSAFA